MSGDPGVDAQLPAEQESEEESVRAPDPSQRTEELHVQGVERTSRPAETGLAQRPGNSPRGLHGLAIIRPVIRVSRSDSGLNA